MYGANTLHNLDERGLSCLDMAVEAQSSSVVEYLISQDLRASGPKQDHSTTLGTAILLMDGSSGPEIVRMLVGHGGASATEIMDEGMTLLHLIAASDTCWLHKNDLVKAFLEKSALVGARETGMDEHLCKHYATLPPKVPLSLSHQPLQPLCVILLTLRSIA
jgi:hypothetical protein